MSESRRLVLVADRCDGCGLCAEACRRHWEYRGPMSVSRPCGSRVIVCQEGISPRVLVCRHCAQPPCVEACPSGALQQDECGLVVLESDECTGCRACIDVCPFEGIRFQEENQTAYKCDLCADLPLPPCVVVCPHAALLRQLTLSEARRRQRQRAQAVGLTIARPSPI